LPTGDYDIAWLHMFRNVSRSGVALQAQIRQLLVAAIENGHLSPGHRLPSSRRLAGMLGIARNTATSAYEELVQEGYLTSHERSGVFVAPLTAALRGAAAASPAAEPRDWAPHFAMQPSRLLHIHKPRDWQRYPYPFLFGQFDPGLFPIQPWRESVGTASSVSSVHDWAGDLIDEDDPELVAQLRARVLPRRAIWAAPDEVMITIGAQQGLYLAIRLLAGDGTPVAMEEPGYPDARHMVRLAGGRLHLLCVDGEGAVPDAGLAGCRVAILTPGHQCPTTSTMSAGRRRAVLAAVRAHDIAVIEDDYDADLFQEGAAIPPLKSTDAEGRVIYIGSLSKVLAPGLRLGYVVAAAPVIREMRVLRRIMLRHPPSNNQRAMAMFISLGHYRAHLRRVAQVLAERAAAMDRLLPLHLPTCRWQRGPGAASYWISGPPGLDARAMVAAAAAKGVLVEPGDVFFHKTERGRGSFRLGFSSIRTDRIEEGLARLGRLI
jgi:GntR family transcriptional regulator/MocR family aminotransferase